MLLKPCWLLFGPLRFHSCVVGVGNAPPTVPPVAGTHSRCRYARPFRVVPCLGQRSKNVVHSSVSDRCDVLQDDVARSHQANDSEQFVEQARSAASQAGAISGLADVLARESTANNVSCSGGWFVGADVIVNWNSGPMFPQYLLAERFALHKRHGFNSAQPASG